MIKFNLTLYEKKTYTTVLNINSTFDNLYHALRSVAEILESCTVTNLSGSLEVEDVFPSSPSEEEDEEVQP